MKRVCSWLPQNGESLAKILPFHRPWETPAGNRSSAHRERTSGLYRARLATAHFVTGVHVAISPAMGACPGSGEAVIRLLWWR
jgi:hypothetical protein